MEDNQPGRVFMNSKVSAVVFLLVLFAAGSAMADTILVPLQKPTIQAGIDSAAPGDEVVVANGLWTGPGNVNLNFRGKAITVRSSNGPGDCIIDMEHAARAVIFLQGEDVDSVFRGFTLRNGQAAGNGGGILVTGSSSPTIFQNIIEECSASGEGGGIHVSPASSPIITGNLIQRNDATVGGGISLDGSLAAVTSNRFMENSAGEEGGGLRCRQGQPELANNLFFMNSAGTDGGAVHLTGTEITLASTTFDNNIATDHGSGLYCRNCRINVTDCIFSNNSGRDIRVGDVGGRAVVEMDHTLILGGGGQTSVYEGSYLITGDVIINASPRFTGGPLGGHYLHQGSSCIDAGSDDVVNICFTGANGPVCMDELTTRPELLFDVNAVDLGYHYPAGPASALTLWSRVATVPRTVILPQPVQFWISIKPKANPPVQRTAAVTLDLLTANGISYRNWRTGTATIYSDQNFWDVWVQRLPYEPHLTGENTLLLRVEDVTAPPYNQPPYQPSGGWSTDTFILTGIAP
jgi:predicted outer membrane repeat protein